MLLLLNFMLTLRDDIIVHVTRGKPRLHKLKRFGGLSEEVATLAI